MDLLYHQLLNSHWLDRVAFSVQSGLELLWIESRFVFHSEESFSRVNLRFRHARGVFADPFHDDGTGTAIVMENLECRFHTLEVFVRIRGLSRRTAIN